MWSLETWKSGSLRDLGVREFGRSGVQEFRRYGDRETWRSEV